MKKTLLIAAAFFCLSSHAQTGQYRGYRMTERILSERLGGVESGISLLSYLVPDLGSSSFSLLNLLGSYDGGFGAGQREFRNGEPNAVNMLFWYMVLNSLASDIGASCVSSTLPLSEDFRAKLLEVCEWPAGSAKDDKVLENFWLAVMGYDAPEAEYRAWRDFFLNSGFVQRPAAEVVQAMFLAITYNPYFLLNR